MGGVPVENETPRPFMHAGLRQTKKPSWLPPRAQPGGSSRLLTASATAKSSVSGPARAERSGHSGNPEHGSFATGRIEKGKRIRIYGSISMSAVVRFGKKGSHSGPFWICLDLLLVA